MTILSVVKDVCAGVGVSVPTSVFTSLAANRTMQEMLALANEMAQRIAYDSREWRKMKATATFNGDGVATAFNLPSNFQRLLNASNVWKSSAGAAPLQFIANSDEWLHRRLNNIANARGEWTIIGDQMHIFPVLGAGTSAAFVYLNKNCVALNAGGNGDAFVDDGDSFVLDERLLKLGMIWQWKAWKGTPYVEDMSTFTDALAVAMGNDTPAPTIVGRKPISTNVYGSYQGPTDVAGWHWPLN